MKTENNVPRRRFNYPSELYSPSKNLRSVLTYKRSYGKNAFGTISALTLAPGLWLFTADVTHPCCPETGLNSRGKEHSGKSNRHMFAIHLCSCSCRLRNSSRYIPCRHLLWETVTTNTIEDGQGINSDEKEAIITIEDVTAKKDLRVETSGLIDDVSHLGKIDVEAIIANLIEGEEIALGDTMK